MIDPALLRECRWASVPPKVMKNDGGASFSLQRRLQPAVVRRLLACPWSVKEICLGGRGHRTTSTSLDRTIGRRIREGFRHYAEADHGDVIRLKDGRKAFHLHVDDSQKETKIWSSRAKECGSQKGQPSG